MTWSLHALALLNLSRKRFADAEAFWLRAEPIAVSDRSYGQNQALGEDTILDCLILVYRACNRLELMEAIARRRLELAEVDAEDDLKFGFLLGNLAEANQAALSRQRTRFAVLLQVPPSTSWRFAHHSGRSRACWIS